MPKTHATGGEDDPGDEVVAAALLQDVSGQRRAGAGVAVALISIPSTLPLRSSSMRSTSAPPDSR